MTSLTPRLDRLERNLVINGNFDFWQRGTSFSAVGNGNPYLADRFQIVKNDTTANINVARDTSVPTVAESGFQSLYSMKCTVNVADTSIAASDFWSLRYTVEGYDYAPIHGKNARLQFWVRSSKIGKYYVAFSNSAGNRWYTTGYTINSANTWEKKTVDLPLDSTGTWLFDNSAGLRVQWTLASALTTATLNQWQAGTSLLSGSDQVNWLNAVGETFYLAQVMVVPGDLSGTNVDVPFQRCGRNIQDELVMCQRYYEKSYDPGIAPATNSSNTLVNTVLAYLSGAGVAVANEVRFTNVKRGTPTVVFYRDSGADNNWITQSAAGATTARAPTIAILGTGGFTVQFNTSDLRATGHWTADSEI